MSPENNSTTTAAEAVRNLIICDTQFGLTGETTLKLPELLDLQARGWLIEGDENNEFSLTVEGEAVIARALRQALPAELAKQQGDALTMIGSNLRSILDLASKMGGGAYQLTVANIQHETNHALQLLEASLAARQPGAQEPVDAIERIARLLYLRSCNRYSDGTPFTDWEGLADNLKDYSRDEARKYEALRNTALWPAGRENYTPSEAIR